MKSRLEAIKNVIKVFKENPEDRKQIIFENTAHPVSKHLEGISEICRAEGCGVSETVNILKGAFVTMQGVYRLPMRLEITVDNGTNIVELIVDNVPVLEIHVQPIDKSNKAHDMAKHFMVEVLGIDPEKVEEIARKIKEDYKNEEINSRS